MAAQQAARNAGSRHTRNHRYSIVTGQGRSGTNWLLDLLDTSPDTFCRNEPNAIPGSPFEVLGPLWLNDVNADIWEREWDGVADVATLSMGERDHPFAVQKSFTRPLVQQLKIADRYHGRRSLESLRRVFPSLRPGQFPMPSIVASSNSLAKAHGVLKINRANGVLRWVLNNRPDVPVINIVRHPAGRHLSYTKRFLSLHDHDEALAESRSWLHTIREHDDVWGDRFGDIEAMDHLDAHMWMWRYVNESLDDTGLPSRQYHRLVYEELGADPLGHVELLYKALDLQWDADAQKAAKDAVQLSNWGKVEDFQAVADAWKRNLDRDDADRIMKHLAASPMASLWR